MYSSAVLDFAKRKKHGYNSRETYNVIVYILIRSRPSTLVRNVCVFVWVHFSDRFHIDVFWVKTLNILVWMGS